MTRDRALALDAADPLAGLRDQFELPPGLIYLDGNSLGALPAATAARLEQVVAAEWGEGLVRSWNSAGWIDLARRVGDKIARLVGAGAGELAVADSTSVNLYKALSAALALVDAAAPARRILLSERTNFPTDLYIAASVARERGFELQFAEADELPQRLDARVAVLLLTQVNYRTGRMHDLAAMTAAAHAAGAIAVWDLAHSAGAVPVDLAGSGADFAVGCGYKYLNGGPGAPAFVWVHRRHVERVAQPLAGWLGHAAPFDFTPDYRPAPGIARFQCGTPPVLSLAALECGVDTVLAAGPLGGMAALRAKSLALSEEFIAAVEGRCAGLGLTLVSPRDGAARGSQVCFSHSGDGYAVMQALAARGVIGDFRAGSSGAATDETAAGASEDGPAALPAILRFGFAPLYNRHIDVWNAVEQLRQVIASGEWGEARFRTRGVVT